MRHRDLSHQPNAYFWHWWALFRNKLPSCSSSCLFKPHGKHYRHIIGKCSRSRWIPPGDAFRRFKGVSSTQKAQEFHNQALTLPCKDTGGRSEDAEDEGRKKDDEAQPVFWTCVCDDKAVLHSVQTCYSSMLVAHCTQCRKYGVICSCANCKMPM